YYSHLLYTSGPPLELHSFPTRRSSDLVISRVFGSLNSSGSTKNETGMSTLWPASSVCSSKQKQAILLKYCPALSGVTLKEAWPRSEEHTSELQSRENLVCRLLPEKK